MTNALDLGCGDNPQNPFGATHLFGIDSTRTAKREDSIVEVKTADLATAPIPYPDAFFDYVTAFDFLEHVPRLIYLDAKSKTPFVDLLSEVYRVLKPGGIFYSLTPAYPSPKAFQDPTHVNIITEDTFPKYFCGDFPWARAYGFKGTFTLLLQEWRDESHLACQMQKT